MRRFLHLAALLGSCAVFSAGGWWLATATGFRQDGFVHDSSQPGRAGARSAARAETGESISVPMTPEEAKRKILAQARTEDLWRWFREYPVWGRDSISRELVDRLGWAAWDAARAGEDPEDHGAAERAILCELAERDPERAFKIWRDHFEEFVDEDNPVWGADVLKRVMKEMGQGPAAQMIEMMSQCDGRVGVILYSLEYRPGFDFAAVADYMSREERSGIAPDNLLEGWARQSPVAASRWMLEHADWIKDHQFDTLRHVIQEVAAEPVDAPGRAEALEILGRMPAEDLKDAWFYHGGEGRLPVSLLEAATAMNQRRAFLTSSFFETLGADTIDPTWRQLPAADRQMLWDDMARLEDPSNLSPAERGGWERWRKMIREAWETEK